MFDTNLSDAKRFMLAMGGGLLFSLACLTAALGPANANPTHPASVHATADRPALL